MGYRIMKDKMAKYMVDVYNKGNLTKEQKELLKDFAKFVIDDYIQDDIYTIYEDCKDDIKDCDDECEDLWELEDCEYKANVLEPQVSELNRR